MGWVFSFSVSWQSLDKHVSPMDCFPIGEEGQGHWYGGGETLTGAWPIDKGTVKLSAFVTGDEVRLHTLPTWSPAKGRKRNECLEFAPEPITFSEIVFFLQ